MNDQAETVDNQERYFKNVLQLTEYLISCGFKVSKTKSNRDKKNGILRVQKDGTITPSDAKAYALTLKKVGYSPVNLERIYEKKSEKEYEKIELEVEKLKFMLDKERGKFLLREDFEMEVSGRAAVLDTGIKNLVYTKTAEWVRAVGGKDEKTNLLIEMAIQEFDQLMHDYSSMDRFTVIFSE